MSEANAKKPPRCHTTECNHVGVRLVRHVEHFESGHSESVEKWRCESCYYAMAVGALTRPDEIETVERQ